MNNVMLDFAVDPFLAFTMVKKGYSMLLDSKLQLKDYGNYSIIVFNPQMTLSYKNSEVLIKEKDNVSTSDEDFLEVLDKYLEKNKSANSDWVFSGGFVGYFSYDFGMEVMGVERNNRSNMGVPEVFLGYYEDFIIIDHIHNTMTVNTDNAEIVDILKGIREKQYTPGKLNSLELGSNFSMEEYMEGVNRVREYIRQGEVYQVNVSQQFSAKGSIDSFDVYSILRNTNYGSYNAFLEVEGGIALSTSPEQFIRKRGNNITARPIKGTTKKSSNKEENERMKRLLLESDKIKSELLMIIDLERNDLSRVCVPGTVEVTSLFEVEEYATVNHLVSTIQGKLLDDIKFSDIMRAMFPGGSITGAPKLRSMEVIEEIENVARGIYTGSIGYISNNGNFDFNIAIRTIVIDEEGICYNVGGGIVWDSDPEDEFEETLHKGKALYAALTQ
jgi:para-aminobenzoate synthetase component 1